MRIFVIVGFDLTCVGNESGANEASFLIMCYLLIVKQITTEESVWFE